jgi:hypothetical protein
VLSLPPKRVEADRARLIGRVEHHDVVETFPRQAGQHVVDQVALAVDEHRRPAVSGVLQEQVGQQGRLADAGRPEQPAVLQRVAQADGQRPVAASCGAVTDDSAAARNRRGDGQGD